MAGGALVGPLIADLHAAGRLRVWSIVVTAFGDMVAPRGGVIALPALRALLEGVGVEPGALRAALSRLTSDGWLTRAVQGRSAVYALAPARAAEVAAAGPRFYGAHPPPAVLAVTEGEGAALALAGFGALRPGVWVGPATAVLPPGTLAVPLAGPQAAWAAARLSPPALGQGYAELRARAAEALPRAAGAGEHEAAVARLLLVHAWRRLVLRDRDLPPDLRPADWPGGPAREMVGSLYRALLPASEAWLDGCAGPDGPLPPADPAVWRRFA